jgi:hypothetical protein
LYQDVANPQNADEGWNNANNRRYDRGNCTNGAEDRRHIFNLSGTAASPQFSNRTLRMVASGWQLAPILRILSGQALNIEDNTDPGQIFMLHQRPNLNGSAYGDGSITNFLNAKAFSKTAPGTLGNVSRGSIFGPGTWQFDVALTRSFRIKESQKVEFRAEAFNVTNSFRMDNPTAPGSAVGSSLVNFTGPTFGKVIAARDPRIMQFAMKYIF